MTSDKESGVIDHWVNAIHQGNCRNVLDEIPDESVHAVVTDPPYGLNFMGRDWDNFRRRNNEADAGRDNVFGRTTSTSPAHGAETEGKNYQKACEVWARPCLNLLKPGGHLLAFSGNRTHHRMFAGVEDAGFEIRDTLTWHYGQGFPKNTDTQLKPSTEFVVLARKPCEGPAKGCYDEYGTAYLNIDGCRLEPGEGGDRDGEETADERYTDEGGTNIAAKPGPRGGSSEGRYPANVIFDECSGRLLDQQSGDCGDLVPQPHKDNKIGDDGLYGDERSRGGDTYYSDGGGASRFFYTSKATKAERTLNGQIDNAHPTVKPQDLMEWLVRLVTAGDQIVLDPFAGTGTTCKAAKELGRRFIGIEKQAKWADVARVRCGLEPEDPSHVRPDDDQTGLEVFVDG